MIAAIATIALLGSALFASVASAKKAAPTPTAYLALGDSLSFGYKAVTFNANQAANKANCEAAIAAAGKGETEVAAAQDALCEPIASFEPGFVGIFGKKLAVAEKKVGNALTTVNLGCPGETSDGLIGHLLGGEGAEFNPCSYHNFLPGGAGYPLKTQFGTSSELEAAVSLITTKSAGTVSAVSLQIGSNDELAVVGKCETPAYDAEHGFASLTACIEHEAGPEGYAYSGGLFHHILVNIGTTIGVLREGAGYTGKVLVLGFYNPDAQLLPGSDKLDKILNEALEGTIASNGYGPGVELAQPFTLINPEAALYKEGETSKENAQKENKERHALCKYTEICAHNDIHPTEKGYKAIAKLMDEAF
jgi:lysophospholipase L1-like esterase